MWWRFVKLTKYSAVCSKKRTKNHTWKSRIHISCCEGQFGECFCVCAHRNNKSYKCVFPEYYFWEYFATKYFSSFFKLNFLKFLLCYHIVFETYCHIGSLVHYILLSKLFYRCANLQFLNGKLKFCKPSMKHNLVCDVYDRNMLKTCWFNNDIISIGIGNVT